LQVAFKRKGGQKEVWIMNSYLFEQFLGGTEVDRVTGQQSGFFIELVDLET
jgi:hypothetical protein